MWLYRAHHYVCHIVTVSSQACYCHISFFAVRGATANNVQFYEWMIDEQIQYEYKYRNMKNLYFVPYLKLHAAGSNKD